MKVVSTWFYTSCLVTWPANEQCESWWQWGDSVHARYSACRSSWHVVAHLRLSQGLSYSLCHLWLFCSFSVPLSSFVAYTCLPNLPVILPLNFILYRVTSLTLILPTIFGVSVIYNMIYCVMVKLVAYFRICSYMVDSTKLPASVELAQARPNK